MKTVSYVCPKHDDEVFFKDSQPENLTGHAKKILMKAVIGLVGGVAFAGAGAAPVFGFGPNIGPFECKKCKKHYFIWECKKNED